MLPLLILTTLLLPLTQGETCLSRQDVLDIVKELETKLDKKDAEMEMMRAEMVTNLDKKVAEVEAKLDKKDAEIAKIQAQMDMKVESGALPGAVSEAVRDLPQVAISAYQSLWKPSDAINHATITFDHFLSNSTSGGGDGALDLRTGVFTCLTPSVYTINWSGHSGLDPGEVVMYWLYVNGVKMYESKHEDKIHRDTSGYVGMQVSRNMIIHLDLGDTLELRTDPTHFTGIIYRLIFSISLTAF